MVRSAVRPVVVLAAAIVLLLVPAGAAHALPAGFEEVTLADGLVKPTAVAFAPASDGRMFIAEQAGRVRVRRADGTLRPAPLVDWTDRVNAYGDRGLIGIATDRDFADNGFLYLLFVADADGVDDDGPHSSRLVRLTVSAGDDVLAEQTILGGDADRGSCRWPDGRHDTASDAADDCIPSWGTTHAIGTVVSDPRDGTLWLGSGDGTGVAFDDGNRPRRMLTYNEEIAAGKLLHVDRDGRGLPGHAFCPEVDDLDRTCTKIHAKGFRNPFRFTVPSAPGADPIVADVGNERREELNVARAGGNYGWPCWEGADWRPGYYANYIDCGRYQDRTAPDGVVRPKDVDLPVFQYHHDGSDSAVQAGPVFTGGGYPAEYRGSLFFGDYARGFVRRFPADGAGGLAIAPASIVSFGEEHSSLPFTERAAFTQLTSAPNGDLVVVDFMTFGPSGPGPGRVVRISFSESNLQPIARAAVDCGASASPCDVVEPGEPVRFTAGGSFDPDVDPLAYAWDFDGDGATDSTDAAPEHTFAAGGVRTVRLTVSDGRGGTAEASVRVLVGQARPTVEIEEPAADARYDGGATIRYAGSATDAEDGPLGAASLRWEIELVHGGHVHPVVDVAGRAEGTFTIPQDHGLDSFFRVRLVATDSTGLTATATRTIHPRPVELRLNSTPPGVTLGVDDAQVVAPATVRTASGLRSSLRAPETVEHDGRTWRFRDWSDGEQAAERVLAVPRDGAALTARYVADPLPAGTRAGAPPPAAPVPLAPSVDLGASAAPPDPATTPRRGAGARIRLAAPWPKRRRTTRTLTGTVAGVTARPRISVALARSAGGRCRWWSARSRAFRRPASCRRPVWTTARVRATRGGWRFDARLRAAVARRPGRVRVRVATGGRTVAQVTVRVPAAR